MARRLTSAEVAARIPEARRRERADRRAGRRAASAQYDSSSGRVVLELTNGCLFAFPARAVTALDVVPDAKLAAVTVWPGGGVLEWEEFDVQLSVAGLILESIDVRERHRALASLAGRARSQAKAAAARANGRKGGRPRKKRRPASA